MTFFFTFSWKLVKESRLFKKVKTPNLIVFPEQLENLQGNVDQI